MSMMLFIMLYYFSLATGGKGAKLTFPHELEVLEFCEQKNL
jgi:hypothetical protein